MSKVEIFLKELSSALQVLMLYSDNHPKSEEAINSVYKRLTDALGTFREITIGFVGGELVFGKEIFFELSKQTGILTKNLESKGIEKMTFRFGVSKNELKKFMSAVIKKIDDTEDFLNYFERLELENIEVGKIKIDKEVIKDRDNASLTDYESALGVVSESFKEMLRGEFVDSYSTRKAMKSVLSMVLEGRWDLLMLTSIRRHDLSTFVHSLNVSVLAMVFASQLAFTKDDVLDIGAAGLFHDIGKIAISREVINKPSVLTEEEMEYIKSHTILGAEILLHQVDSLGFLPSLVAFEHHLRYDLKGYPKLHYPRKPHFISLMISLCDCYDALRSRRSYKRDYPPEMIYEIMKRGRGGLFNPELFDRFFNFLGVYPVSTIVELNKGWVGIVRRQNEEDIFSPEVEIVSPLQRRGELLDLKGRRDIKIKSSLNPFSTGKDYLSFI